MDYATMEDKYMNDPSAQWAVTATASSTFGDDEGRQPSSTNLASNATGVVDGKTWTNSRQDIGFDWLETTFAKPVQATEVRIVFENGEGIEAINKLELQGTDGKWNTVWSGVSDQKKDSRGGRSWFVRTIEKTPYQVKAVKLTVANAVQRGYKGRRRRAAGRELIVRDAGARTLSAPASTGSRRRPRARPSPT